MINSTPYSAAVSGKAEARTVRFYRQKSVFRLACGEALMPEVEGQFSKIIIFLLGGLFVHRCSSFV